MLNQTVRGLYCMRCGSKKVVRGTLEAARFYPTRSMLRSLLGKPVFLSNANTHACLECGLTWNEVDPYDLRRNLRDYGIIKHSTGVMDVIEGKKVDVAL